jgi:hypothetical protein
MLPTSISCGGVVPFVDELNVQCQQYCPFALASFLHDKLNKMMQTIIIDFTPSRYALQSK